MCHILFATRVSVFIYIPIGANNMMKKKSERMFKKLGYIALDGHQGTDFIKETARADVPDEINMSTVIMNDVNQYYLILNAVTIGEKTFPSTHASGDLKLTKAIMQYMKERKWK
jgi:D-aminopeptidase